MTVFLLAPDPAPLAALLNRCFPTQLVVGTASVIEAGLEAAAQLRPEVVLFSFDTPGSVSWEMALHALRQADAEVVVLSEWPTFAYEAFRFEAAGFALWPPYPDELQAILARVEQRVREKTILRRTPPSSEADSSALSNTPRRPQRIALPQSQHTVEYVHLDQITHIEAERQYCVFNLLDNRRITTSRNIGEYEKLLGGHPFMRVHRSHIVNLEHVRSFHRDEEKLEMPNGKRVDVAKQVRDSVLTRLMWGNGR